ncbi:MAG: hypothetical protein ACOC3V_01345 [bacterium]
MEQGLWDWLITGGVLITMGLAIWARVSNQTIPELLSEIREMFRDNTEDYMPETMVWE